MKLTARNSRRETEQVALEEPLELRLLGEAEPLTLAVLMRTPDQDRALLLGWLAGEGLRPSNFVLFPEPENPNVWFLQTPAAQVQEVMAVARLQLSSSACGVCGTGSIERLAVQASPPLWQAEPLPLPLLTALPELLLTRQEGFRKTGGLHGAALFSASGELVGAAEDVGRHNAVDKVVGQQLLAGSPWPLTDRVLCVSSRAGFEIVQKAVMAGIAVVVSVGAPSSLAVATAEVFGMTLCGFTREGRTTVYAGAERVLGDF